MRTLGLHSPRICTVLPMPHEHIFAVPILKLHIAHHDGPFKFLRCGGRVGDGKPCDAQVIPLNALTEQREAQAQCVGRRHSPFILDFTGARAGERYVTES